MTNKSFPDWVKIGYADDVQKRVKQLNDSSSTPCTFKLFATYEVENRLKDLKLHKLIDKLNPNLRCHEEVNGKTRTREFYQISTADAYQILEAIAEISNTTNRLKKYDDN